MSYQRSGRASGSNMAREMPLLSTDKTSHIKELAPRVVEIAFSSSEIREFTLYLKYVWKFEFPVFLVLLGNHAKLIEVGDLNQEES